MKPDKIYIPKEEVESRMPWIEQPYEDDPNWKECYIRKEALMEYVKDRLAQYDPEYTNAGKELQMIIDKINSL